MSSQKENDINAYVDPEEDEIFFGNVSAQESVIKSRFQSRKSVMLKDTNNVNITSKSSEGLEVQNKFSVKCKEAGNGMLNRSLTRNGAMDIVLEKNELHGLVSDEEMSNLEHDALNKALSETMLEIEEERRDVDKTSVQKSSEANVESHLKHINIKFEHNYSTPVKSKIDKSILSTPKSVVKADKDGGFLKVLSEIALVKAEEEKDLTHVKTGLSNDTNQADLVPAINIIGATPTKPDDESNEEVTLKHETKKFKLIYNTPEKSECSHETERASEDEDMEDAFSSIEERSTENENENDNDKDNVQEVEIKNLTEVKKIKILSESPLSEALLKNIEALKIKCPLELKNDSCEVITLDEESENEEEPELITDLGNLKRELSPRRDSEVEVVEVVTNEPQKMKPEIAFEGEIVVLSLEKNMDISDHDSEELRSEVSESDKEVLNNEVKEIDEVDLESTADNEKGKSQSTPQFLDNSVENQKTDSPNKVHNNLNNNNSENDEIISSLDAKENEEEKTSNESPEKIKDSTSPYKILQEAKKVIDFVEMTANDSDSFSFTLQEFDLDNVNISLSGSDVLSEFNDSIRKSTNILSAKQSELLADIISGKASSQPSTPANTPIKANPAKKSERKIVDLEKPKANSSKKHTTPYRLLNKENAIGKSKTEEKMVKSYQLSAGKKIGTMKGASCGKKDLVQSRPDPKIVKKLDLGPVVNKADLRTPITKNRVKDFKIPTTTSKIPKLGASTSKIPQPGKLQTPKPIRITPGKDTPRPTSSKKTYQKIQSPVVAYIQNKPSSLLKNIKSEVKKDSGRKIWAKELCMGEPNDEESILQTDYFKAMAQAEAALPFVEYRSAPPLKIEKSVESRLPRLAPTMKKLITSNSPTVLKHEGRIKLGIPESVRAESTIDESMPLDPNEVSVVVRQVAQKSSTFK